MPTHRTIIALTLPCAALLALGAAQQPAIDPAWLTFDATARTARFQLIAGLTGLNGALNFNGFRDGGLSFVVPLGWKTEIDFRNHDGMLPHSAEVIAPRASDGPWPRSSYCAWCHTNESRALYNTSPFPLRTVTTADRTAASSRLVANRVRNLPSIVTVPSRGKSQRRWTVAALIRASEHDSWSLLPAVADAKVTRVSGRRLNPANRYPLTVNS